jgi:hypothetical protein
MQKFEKSQRDLRKGVRAGPVLQTGAIAAMQLCPAAPPVL